MAWPTRFRRLLRRAPRLVVLLCSLTAQQASAKNLLQADGPGGTYDLLRTAYTVEVPDCGHMVDHITEEQDADLGRPVFVFQLHVNEDDDRCTATDRQRSEIRARAADIVAAEGETVHYAWKFKLDAGFQGSPNFTHIFQIKSDESAPIMTLTPRVSTLAIDGRIGEHGSTELSKFLGVWVQVELRILYADAGELAMTIRRLSDGEQLFEYAGAADMWDAGASGHDSKFGLYRSLNSSELLRDEPVRFADFCASKVSAAECADTAPEPGAGGAAGAGGSAGAGGVAGAGAPNAAGTGGSGVAGASGAPAAGGTSSGMVGSGAAPTVAGASHGDLPNSAGDESRGDATDASSACACRLPASAPPGNAGTLVLGATCAWFARRRLLRGHGDVVGRGHGSVLGGDPAGRA